MIAQLLEGACRFLLTVDDEYRWTFWRRDTEYEMYVRSFDDEEGSMEEQDERRVWLLTGANGPHILEVTRGASVRAWLTERGPVWARTQPVWYGEEWVGSLSPSFAAALAQGQADAAALELMC